MKKILYLLAALIVSGCKFTLPGNEQLRWATIQKSDALKITSDMIRQNNPELFDPTKDKQGSRRDAESIKNQLDFLQESLGENCRKVPRPKESNVMTICDRPSPHCPGVYDEKCLNEIDANPDVISLKEKMNQIDQDKKYNAAKLKANEVLATQILSNAIADYSMKNGYDLVIDGGNKSSMLFKKEGISIDITDLIIEKIKKDNPDMSLTKEKVLALGSSSYN